MVSRGKGVGEMGEMLVKGYKPSVIRSISSEDLMYRMVTIFNTLLYTWNLLRQ